MRKRMKDAAARLDFERAAEFRDRIRELETWAVETLGEAP
jgi:excinuclease UvrABC nuclease subunit